MKFLFPDKRCFISSIAISNTKVRYSLFTFIFEAFRCITLSSVHDRYEDTICDRDTLIQACPDPVGCPADKDDP